MARPTKLTPDVQQKVIDALRAGNYFEAACGYAGITRETGYNWLKRGESAKEGAFFEFFNAVEKASADAEVQTVAIIKKAMPDTWQAAAWWLERRYPDRWGRQRQEVTGANGAPIETRNTTVLVNAENAHDAGNILKQLAELGAIPPARSEADNDPAPE